MNLEQRIKDRIRHEGPITFAEFMGMALYDAEGGYYRHPERRIGPHGDYFTSPDSHPVFAALIARQVEQMWRLMGEPPSFDVVEFGAGKGLLARDFLTYARDALSRFYEALTYTIVDPAGPAVAVLEEAGVAAKVRWHSPKEAFAPGSLRGCVLSNELLDALPVHRVFMQNGELKEVYLGLSGEDFADVVGELSMPLLADYFKRLGLQPAEGCQAEVNLAALEWVGSVEEALKQGFVLTIDYGYPAQEMYSPKRRRGTLMGYYQHQPVDNPYVHVGQQDLTVHVDFTSVIAEGEGYGLKAVDITSQRDFLLNLGLNAFVDALSKASLPQALYYANRYAMMELVRLEGLGGFAVLAQAKGVDEPWLDGFNRDNLSKKALLAQKSSLRVPLLGEEYTPLLRGRYPHLAWDWEGLLSED